LKYKNGDIYEGYFKDDKKHNYGKLKHNNRDIYEGEWIDDKKWYY